MDTLRAFIREVIEELESKSTTSTASSRKAIGPKSYGSRNQISTARTSTKLQLQKLKQQEKLPDARKVDRYSASDWERFMQQNKDVPVMNYMHDVAAGDKEKVPDKWEDLEHDDSDDFAWKMLVHLRKNKKI